MNKTTYKKNQSAKDYIRRNKDFGVATSDRVYRYEGTEAGRAIVSQFPLSVELENIPARLASITTQREKKVPDPQLGPISSLQEVTVLRNDAQTTLSAIKKRLDVVPVTDVGEDFIAGFDYLMEITPQLKPIKVDRELVDTWLATLDTPKREACLKVLDGPIHWQGMQDREVFAKPESLLKPEGSAARLIHNGNPVVAVVMGAITNALQKRAVIMLSERNPAFKPAEGIKVYFPSGMDDKQVAELRGRTTQGEGTIIEGDFKSNDATQPSGIRKKEAWWYRRLGAPDWYVRECVALTHMNVFSRTLGMKFEIVGQRHSGEEAGTIGNTFNSVCLITGGLIRAKVKRAVVLAYGDDTKIWIPEYSRVQAKEVASLLVESTANHGMEMEVALPSKEHATFLQTRVHLTTGGEAVPFPKMGRYLSKLNVRANNNPDISNRDYAAGRYLGLAHQFRYFPTISRVLLDYSDKLSSTPWIERKHKAWKPVTDPNMLRSSILEVRRPLKRDEEMLAFDNVYGISLDEAVNQVHLFGLGAFVRCASTDRSDRHTLAQLVAIGKKRGLVPVDDVDNPTIASMILVDNKDLVNIQGDLSVL